MNELAAVRGVFAAAKIGRWFAGLKAAWKARTLEWFFGPGLSGRDAGARRGSEQGPGGGSGRGIGRSDASRAASMAEELDGVEACRLIREIEKARREWAIAQQKLDYVAEPDQIDYAIYCLEAAEKRYEMLLRQAKKAKLSLLDPDTGRIRACRSRD